MEKVLEGIAKESGSAKTSEGEVYSGGNRSSERSARGNEGYSTFAEMYLEKPVDMGITASVSTWRGIPTIDDW